MNIPLGNGNSITVDAFNGKVWLTLRAKGGGITVALENLEATETANAITAGVLANRKEANLAKKHPPQ